MIETFFNSLQEIREKYRSMADKTEYSFNIFNILNLDSKELIHSAFITEFLNPQGSHKMGNIFLQLFYETLGYECPKEVSVYKEYQTKEGRIDIYVLAKNNPSLSVIIENKIYAKDQSQQLYRYHKYDSKAHLIYLTLDGKEPSKDSLAGLGENNYRAISYDEIIIPWLEKCLEKVREKPILKETTEQYINLIKQLMGQTMFEAEKHKISEMIEKNKDYLLLSLYLIKNPEAVYPALEKYIRTEIEFAATEVGLFVNLPDSLMRSYASIIFVTGKDFDIIVEPQLNNFGALISGIIPANGKDKKDLSQDVCDKIREKYAKQIKEPLQEANPIAHNYWDPYKKSWSVFEYEKVMDGTFKNDLVGLLKKLKLFVDSL